MRLPGKLAAELEEQDLGALVHDGVPEGPILDYKLELKFGSRDEKKELLKDVTSFANSGGGLVLFGVDEDEEGVAKGIVGIDANPDEVTPAVESSILNNTEPRIAGMQMHWIPVRRSRWVLAMSVPMSWHKPHRVTLDGSNRFWCRASRHVYELDVEQLRALFLEQSHGADAVRRTRATRLERIASRDLFLPDPLVLGPLLVVHVVPLRPAASDVVYQLPSRDLAAEKLTLMWGNAPSQPKLNLDGIIVTSAGGSEVRAYTQLYRNGMIESADGAMLAGLGDKPHYIPTDIFEPAIADASRNYLGLLREMEVTLPLVLAITLLDVKGMTFAVSGPGLLGEIHRIDRDTVLLPDVTLTEWPPQIGDVLRSPFDALWNACGYPRSKHYTSDGKWRHRDA